jgi:hypothetical protein
VLEEGMSLHETGYTLDELRAMTGEERMQIVFRKSDELRRSIAERFRAEHPGCAEWEVKLELLRYSFAPEPVPAAVEAAMREYGERRGDDRDRRS